MFKKIAFYFSIYFLGLTLLASADREPKATSIDEEIRKSRSGRASTQTEMREFLSSLGVTGNLSQERLHQLQQSGLRQVRGRERTVNMLHKKVRRQEQQLQEKESELLRKYEQLSMLAERSDSRTYEELGIDLVEESLDELQDARRMIVREIRDLEKTLSEVAHDTRKTTALLASTPTLAPPPQTQEELETMRTRMQRTSLGAIAMEGADKAVAFAHHTFEMAESLKEHLQSLLNLRLRPLRENLNQSIEKQAALARTILTLTSAEGEEDGETSCPSETVEGEIQQVVSLLRMPPLEAEVKETVEKDPLLIEAEEMVEAVRKESRSKKGKKKSKKIENEEATPLFPPLEAEELVGYQDCLRHHRDLFLRFFEDPTPHNEISFDDFKKLVNALKGSMIARGSHFRASLENSSRILELSTQPVGEKPTKRQKATVVRYHGRKKGRSLLSRSSVMMVRMYLFEANGLTPDQLFSEEALSSVATNTTPSSR